jgi:hypothetical protein
VKNHDILDKPLTNLLQHKHFQWSDEAQQASDTLKQAMSSTHVLSLPNFEMHFVIEIDACDK